MINTVADLVLCVVTPLIVVYNSSVSDTKVNIMFRRPFVRVCLLILILIFVALVSLRPLWVYFVGKTEPKIICLVYIEVKLWIQLNLWSQLNPKLKRFNKILCDVRERRIILSVLDPSPSTPAPIKFFFVYFIICMIDKKYNEYCAPHQTSGHCSHLEFHSTPEVQQPSPNDDLLWNPQINWSLLQECLKSFWIVFHSFFNNICWLKIDW